MLTFNRLLFRFLQKKFKIYQHTFRGLILTGISSCTHVRSLNVSHLGMTGATELKITAARSLSVARRPS
jgi:hypothetical protein